MPAPLRGLRIVDLGGDLAGTAARELAALGADVVMVEPPEGVPTRRLPPFLGGVSGPERSLRFAHQNAGKRSLVLDLDAEPGREGLDRLARTSAVVVFGGSAARFDALRLDQLVSRHELILGAVTPYGLSGPRRDWAGGELTAWAAGAGASMVGDPDRAPVAPGGETATAFASRLLLTGLLGAIRAHRLGRGVCSVDISLQEAVAALTAESGLHTFLDDLIPRRRMGSSRIGGGPFGNFPSADGYVSLIAAQAPHWDALAAWIAEETGNREVLDESLRGNLSARFHTHELVDVFTADLTARHTSAHLFLEGQRRGVTVTPVNDLHGVLEDPQLRAHGFWTKAVVDGQAITAPRGAFEAAGPPVPRLGQHTAELLTELGLAGEQETT
jgi:benzylsuccinate CoA-transferase BbsE subunit